MARLIAEIGINHLGDPSKLYQMITELAEAGVDACKLQYRSPAGFFDESLEMGSTLISQELDLVNLEMAEYREAHETAASKGIKIGVSFFRKADADFYLTHATPDFIKVPSAEALNFALINYLIQKPIPLIVSTGGLTYRQLRSLAENVTFRPDDCVMYCVANYPAKDGTANPNYIVEYAKLFNCKVGYSSHDVSWEMNLAMLSHGAELIERHYAQNLDDEGLDISTSSDLDDIKRLQYFCRLPLWASEQRIEDKIPNQGEIQNLKDLGSGYVFDRNYVKGDYVDVASLIISSPCRGIRAGSVSGNLKIVRAAKEGAPLTESHLLLAPKLKYHYKNCVTKRKISLPIRLHDFKIIDETFDLHDYEWHLSFQEVERVDDVFIKDNIDFIKKKRFSIHLPDYISSNHLIDPFSKNTNIKDHSRSLIKKTTDFAERLQDLTGETVPVVGSFSVIDSCRESFYQRYAEFIQLTHASSSVKIYPQFLPKLAWYFGGSVLLDVFCDIEDKAFMEILPFGICLDTAHCIMAANYKGARPDEWLRELSPLSGHYHISDAHGVDGEGVPFGEGDLGEVINDVLLAPERKVIEQWEGHLNDFSGFKSAVNFVSDITL